MTYVSAPIVEAVVVSVIDLNSCWFTHKEAVHINVLTEHPCLRVPFFSARGSEPGKVHQRVVIICIDVRDETLGKLDNHLFTLIGQAEVLNARHQRSLQSIEPVFALKIMVSPSRSNSSNLRSMSRIVAPAMRSDSATS